jgi:hypothetical protein
MKQTLAFIRDWIEYTPTFFANVHPTEWWDYFGSCHRVCCTLMLAREKLEDEK